MLFHLLACVPPVHRPIPAATWRWWVCWRWGRMIWLQACSWGAPSAVCGVGGVGVWGVRERHVCGVRECVVYVCYSGTTSRSFVRWGSCVFCTHNMHCVHQNMHHTTHTNTPKHPPPHTLTASCSTPVNASVINLLRSSPNRCCSVDRGSASTCPAVVAPHRDAKS